ncbi:MAG: hypothetical protein MOB07_31010 [Acidobacteria bacterium]|nr:hypothetical protein [Acidobacteriota bacterium]
MAKVREDEEDNLVIDGVPGFFFETEAWVNGHELQNNMMSKITEIYVYSEDVER